jgi:hypothetical protein
VVNGDFSNDMYKWGFSGGTATIKEKYGNYYLEFNTPSSSASVSQQINLERGKKYIISAIYVNNCKKGTPGYDAVNCQIKLKFIWEFVDSIISLDKLNFNIK